MKRKTSPPTMLPAPMPMDAVSVRLRALVDACLKGTGQTLARDIKTMSSWFGEERKQRRADYMNDRALRDAYVAFFVPQYAAKLASFLRRMEAEGICRLPPNPRVLDVGAGPLTATLGVWLWRGALQQSAAIDLSMRSMQTGLALLEQLDATLAREVALKEQSAMARPPDGPFDLIVAAHVLNEVGDPRRSIEDRVSTLRGLMTRLAPGGRLIVMEPATRVHGQALMRVREALVQASVYPLYPCTGAETCPLLDGESWCHADEDWQPPPRYLELTYKAELKKDVLKHATLVLGRDGNAIGGVRLVGGLMRTPRGSMRYGCAAPGLVTLGDERALTRDAAAALRGAHVPLPPEQLPPPLAARPATTPSRTTAPRPSPARQPADASAREARGPNARRGSVAKPRGPR